MIKPIYHPHWLWEEIKSNMWGEAENRENLLKKVIFFMQNHIEFGQAMNQVILNWKYSCEHNLSKMGMNRIAWLGQAACAFTLNCPENITREGWKYLTDEQRELANKQAEINIAYWEKNQCPKNQLELMF